MRVILHDPVQARLTRLMGALKAEGFLPAVLPEAAIRSGAAGLDENASGLLPIILGLAPDADAARNVRKLRSSGTMSPLLILQDGLSGEAVARTLDAGADDVVGGACEPAEVAARLRAISRKQFNLRTPEVRTGNLTVYLDGRDPDVNGETVRLSASENAILKNLALNIGKVVRRETLFDALYAFAEYQPYMKALDVHICKLRRKLGASAPGAGSWIRTHNGRGYSLAETVE